ATPLRRGTTYGWQMVGRPLPGVGMHVVDAAGNLLPAGVPGELCLAGAGVARGYLGRPDVTADRFVPDAFSGEAGARLYRTGDRVRRRADGELEFLGRVDAQVKIRGFRIEPGEIEAVLLEQEGVHEAVVLVREDPAFGMPGQKRLAAYVVPVAGAELATAELRSRLGQRLPDYMVPSAFVVLDKLPLNANGKVDPRALPAPEEAAGRGEYVAPATPTQRFVAEVWGEALGIERVGVDDSFFELGGHSLLLVRVHARLRERFPEGVALVDLFEHRTLGTLAEYLDGLSGRAAEATADVMEQSRERGAARRERVNRHRATRPGRG
ncbi:MAG: phosphopantetheine-binding protein, partial [Longimicrobiaceae bacterium]